MRSKSDWTTRPLEDELGEALRAELLGWPGVTARPVMGCLAFFRGKPATAGAKAAHMLGCYVNRDVAKKKTEWLNRAGEPTFVWVRLRKEDAERALRRPGVTQSRLGFPGWIGIPLESRAMLAEAVR